MLKDKLRISGIAVSRLKGREKERNAIRVLQVPEDREFTEVRDEML